MATANVIFGKVDGGMPVLDSEFTSEAVASGGTSAAAPATAGFARVTALGAAMYAAFGSAPNPAVDPRIYIPAESAVELAITAGTKVAVVDA